MDNEELKIVEIRVKNLMLSKQLIINTLTVIVGGVIGLLLVPASSLRVALIIAGVLYALVLIKSFQNINAEINGYLYGNKNDKRR